MVKDYTYDTELRCPHCGEVSPYRMRTLINRSVDPDATEKLLDGSWFTFTCPHCGERQIAVYSCLYYDQDNRYIVALADSDEDEEQFLQWMNGVYQRDTLDGALNAMLRSCDCRVVRTMSEMQEKVLIKELDLDDKVIEMCKVLVEQILVQEGLVQDVQAMFFNTDGEDWKLLSDVGEEDMAETDLPVEMYKDVENLLENKNLANTFKINREWALNMLRSGMN